MLEEFARKSEGPDFKLEAYDWAYFAEKMRKEQYDIDEAQLSEYFVLDNVLHDGVFYEPTSSMVSPSSSAPMFLFTTQT